MSSKLASLFTQSIKLSRYLRQIIQLELIKLTKLNPMLNKIRALSIQTIAATTRFFKSLSATKSNWLKLKSRLQQYIKLTRLDRPIGLLLLLWPTLWALWIAAEGLPRTDVLLVFLLGVVLMRSAGCVLNDIADQRFDPLVTRTSCRPLASGQVTPKEALIVAGVLICIAFLMVLTMNMLTIQLAFVAMILAGIYPFMKRYTYLPQFFLGLAFGWSIPMAFAAQTETIPNIAWLLLITNILWAVAYDTIYAMIDREDDLKIGVKSTAILFDDLDRIMIGIIQGLVITTLVIIGYQLNLGHFYLSGISIASFLFIYQLYLIADRGHVNYMNAFLNNNWFGMVVFLGLFLDYL